MVIVYRLLFVDPMYVVLFLSITVDFVIVVFVLKV